MQRDYTSCLKVIAPAADRAESMQSFVDVVWERLRSTHISWIGFYLPSDGHSMVLGPRRDKPACSPIGLHGACGRAFLNRRTMVIKDVAELGEQYIACDPRDRSELVIPLFESDGNVWGVLDVDSYETSAFSDDDAAGFTQLLLKAGLTCEIH